MSEVILNDVPVRFPFEPYEVQKNYMQKLIECLQKRENGILESPTGTGKTLCLLCASLAWLEIKKAEHRANVIGSQMNEDSNQEMINSVQSQLQSATGGMWKLGTGCPKIIYSSRTHSQLSQAVNELKKTTYRHMKVSVLGSRDQMCIHPEVSRETNNHNKVHMCQIRVKGRNCYFYNQVEHKKLDPEVRQGLHDLEDLVKLGKKRTFCPYYMARELRQDADIIFLPYNYLLDLRSRKAHGIELQGNIVIFDEAHNVEKICEESASLQLRSTDLALCIDEVTSVMKKLQELAESNLGAGENALLPEDFSAEDLYILKTIFLELEKAVDEISLPADGSGVTYPGSFMFDLLKKADITPNKKSVIIELLDRLIQYLTTNSSSPFQRKGAGLQKFSELIKIVFSKDNFSFSHMEFVKQCYKVHFSVEEKRKPKEGWNAPKLNTINAKQGKVLSYWCFNPGFGMKELAEQGVHSIILTSGTLSPLESFTSELQIPFPIQLENPHIIKPSQVWISAICRGPDGTILNSSYQNRSKPEYLNSLGSTILNFSRVIPGGLLVFFPSYPIMKMCQEHWQNAGIWAGIYKMKPIFVESQSKEVFASSMNDFYEKIRDPALNGACFFAVCRGKVSEGLDFSNQNGRAVIITGLPYPPFKDPRVVLKQKYLEEVRAKKKSGLTGSSWYRLEASRAVNQAIGRVIRHKDDFGAIILCDKRFSEPSFKQEFSMWVRPHIKLYEKFGSTIKDVIQFFRITKSMFPNSDVTSKPSIICSSNQLKIEYESEPNSSHFVKPLASAFGQISSRPVTANKVEKFTEVANSFDSKILYQGHSASLNNENKEPKSLFSALDEKSSVLDFNNKNVLQRKNSPDSTINSDNMLVPRKKKIKIISKSEKYLNDFIKNSSGKNEDSKDSDENKTDQRTESPAMFSATNSKIVSQNKPENGNEPDQTELKNVKIVKYLKMVKFVLSKEEYVSFSDGIKHYKRDADVDSMIATLLQLFGTETSRHHLLLKFSLFLRPDHRNQLNSIYKDLTNI